jgi:SAM-dependent methyltransferase
MLPRLGRHAAPWRRRRPAAWIAWASDGAHPLPGAARGHVVGAGDADHSRPPPTTPPPPLSQQPPPKTTPPSSSLARELRGWLRYLSPLSRFSATFYRTDARIADQVVALALERGAAGSGAQARGVLVDLGCGDGAVMAAALRLAAARNGGGGILSSIVGYELDPELAEEARRRCAAEATKLSSAAEHAKLRPVLSLPAVRVVQGDAADADLSEATAVMLYMSARANAQLLGPGPRAATGAGAGAGEAAMTRSARSLRRGSCVASLGFPVGGWDAWKVEERALMHGGGGGGSVPLFMYIVGGPGCK